MKYRSLILALAVALALLPCCAQAQSVPYTVNLSATEEIFAGPGYAYDYVRDVSSDGVYTIVEEQIDDDYNIWGRLKSGAGWVVLGIAERDSSYTMSISGDTAIYAGPGYDYAYVRDVGEDGVYTIVEEQIDDDYNVWGKLKSGAGWVFIENDWADTFYTVPLGGWVQIFEAPGYDYSYVGDVGADGVYTITAEYLDDEGNYWGQLKSGAGWVNLTEVRTKGNPAISAGYADEKLISEGGYVFYSMHDSEYVTKVVFRAHEFLKDVELCLLDYDEYGNYIPA
ncbi:MAG: hypothetical protein IJA26_06045, partial [Clostridia bacterium]|nr:hypothetical protein [Clostridia bacterium]